MLTASALGGQGEVHLRLGRTEAALEELRSAAHTLQEVDDWESLPFVLVALGDGFRCAGQLDEAATVYHNTLDMARARADSGTEMFALAGLLTTALALDNPDLAVESTQTLLALLANRQIDYSFADPALLFVAGYQGLAAAANDPADDRALAVLQSRYQTLMAVAANIEAEALRHSLLENVPANRELLTLCRQHFA